MTVNLTNFSVPPVPATTWQPGPPTWIAPPFKEQYTGSPLVGSTVALTGVFTEWILDATDPAFVQPSGSFGIQIFEQQTMGVLTAEVGTPIPGVSFNGMTLASSPLNGIPGPGFGLPIELFITIFTADQMYSAQLFPPGGGVASPVIGTTDIGADDAINAWIAGNGFPDGTPVFIIADAQVEYTAEWNDMPLVAGSSVTISNSVSLGPYLVAPPGLLNVMDAGGWTALGTAGKPVSIKQPDGSWKVYDGTGTRPLKVMTPTGWQIVSYSSE